MTTTKTHLRTIDEFLSLFSRVRPIGQNQWQALCPAHSDHEPSLNIRLADQKILVHCLAGCLPNAIVQAVGLTMASLYLDNHHGNYTQKEIVCSYPYHSAYGELLFEVIRCRNPKSFFQRRPDGAWGLRGITPVIYHLPEVLEAIAAGNTICICEGEKDADNLSSMGFTATTNPMGALKWRPSYTESLKGAALAVIFADNDAPGRKHARQVAQSLYEVGTAVKVVEMPGEGIKDVSDWLQDGLTRDKLLEIITSAPPWEPSAGILDKDIPIVFNRTDLGNAERLVARYGEDIRYCFQRKSWLIWVGTHWQWDLGSGGIMRLAQRTVRTIYEEAAREDDEGERKKIADWAKASESNMRLNAMIAQTEPLCRVELDQLDSNFWLFNCRNGTVDLRTGELRPAVKEDYLTMLAPVEYSPTAQSDLWEQFLNKIFNGNKNLIRYLQRCIGYTLTGDTSEQTFFFCHGSGMNGKSTFLNALMEIMAPYAIQADIEMFLSSFKPIKSGHSEDLANLAGRRFVVASEIEEGRRLAVPRLKHMTGGERVRASHKHEREFEYAVTYKIWLNSNHKPDITDTTYSIWRRVKLVPFNVVIPVEEQDKHLRERLREEYPAILAWAVQGCLDWQQAGLEEPVEVARAIEEYRQEQDVLGDFLRARCYLDLKNAECTVPHKELYAGYQEWCGENSVDPVTSRTFARRLKEKDYIGKFTSHGQIKWRYIRLRGVDKVDVGDEFPSYSLYEGNKKKNIGNPPTLSTSSTRPLPLSSTPSTNETPEYPIAPCRCGSIDFWLREAGDWGPARWLCCRCHPKPGGEK